MRADQSASEPNKIKKTYSSFFDFDFKKIQNVNAVPPLNPNGQRWVFPNLSFLEGHKTQKLLSCFMIINGRRKEKSEKTDGQLLDKHSALNFAPD